MFRFAFLSPFLCALVSCADASLAELHSEQCYASNDCPSGQICNEFNQCVPAGDVGPSFVPPEAEPIVGQPQGGLHHVYVVMSKLDSVARINAESLEVRSVPVGDNPIAVATVPDQDVAVVLNKGSQSVSIVRTQEDRDTVITLPAQGDLNRLVISPRGDKAVAFFVLDDPTASTVGSLQDVSVIHLQAEAERVTNVSVGFRPTAVSFTSSGNHALVTTEDGISIVDLVRQQQDYIAPTVALSQQPLLDGAADEVVVAADGQYAYARWQNLSAVRVVNLRDGGIFDFPLESPPSDIDLTSDNQLLMAVVRESSQLAVFDIPQQITQVLTPRLLTTGSLEVGQVELTGDNQFALAFTNTINQKAIARIQLQNGEVTLVPLRKGVRTVHIAPDNLTALIVHNKIPGEPLPQDDLETVLDKRYGYSICAIDTLFSKLQLVDTNPGDLAFLPDSTMAYIILADATEQIQWVQAADLTSFHSNTFTFGSLPTDIGVIGGTTRVFVLQDHPLGRVSFITPADNTASSEVRTVTGFQLNSQVTE